MIDFAPPPEVTDLAAQVSRFVQDVCIAAEARDSGPHGLEPSLRAELQEAARAAGVFAPHVARELGGHGLDLRGQAVVFEAAGRSLLGPQALNCAAPDEGNMHLLSVVASPEQKERFLVPLAAGEIRSCFAMTEPAPGAGSDPAMLQTEATRIDGGWAINGRKHFITGAEGAGFMICMVRTDAEIKRARGATMFLVDAANSGVRIERSIPTTDRGFVGGHAEVVFEDCRVSDADILGEAGLGYQYAQVRLGPARLTHCMRWTGLAARALDIATDHVAEREAFGRTLGEHGLVRGMLADSLIDLETSRLLIQRAAWEIDNKGDETHWSSLAKSHVAEATHRVIDRSVQLCGGLGVSEDLPLARFLAEIRPFRIYDGPTETHRWAIGRRMVRSRGARVVS
jgi:acyl-CoA dehydrogenase